MHPIKSKYNKFFLILITFFCISCGIFEDKKVHFANTYRQILINRELAPDSLTASRNMLNILEKNGYDIDSFREQFSELAKDNPTEFAQMLDTMRAGIQKDIQKIKSTKK
jgi:hypothetical protein